MSKDICDAYLEILESLSRVSLRELEKIAEPGLVRDRFNLFVEDLLCAYYNKDGRSYEVASRSPFFRSAVAGRLLRE